MKCLRNLKDSKAVYTAGEDSVVKIHAARGCWWLHVEPRAGAPQLHVNKPVTDVSIDSTSRIARTLDDVESPHGIKLGGVSKGIICVCPIGPSSISLHKN